jgi:hypothetical protein
MERVAGGWLLQLATIGEAIAAFPLVLTNLKSEDLTRGEVEAALVRLRAGEPVNQIKPVRNPMLE